jgi:hypothetical protein
MVAGQDTCEICKTPLQFITDSSQAPKMECVYCKKTFTATIFCPKGHYICDSCHAKDTIAVLKEFSKSTTEKNPYIIADTLLHHPAFKDYGPEHHLMVPVVLLTALRNNGCVKSSGKPIQAKDITEAITRASKVPGGWCGLYGTCGGAVGAGIAISILTDSTPSTHLTRSFANKVTGKALLRIADNLEHCCKRSYRYSFEEAIALLQEEFHYLMEYSKPGKCPFSANNKKCSKKACPYFDNC